MTPQPSELQRPPEDLNPQGQSQATNPPPTPPASGRPRRPRPEPRPERRARRVVTLDSYTQELLEWVSAECDPEAWEALIARKDDAGAPPWLNGPALGLDELSHQILALSLAHLVHTTSRLPDSPFERGEDLDGACLVRHIPLTPPQGTYELARRLSLSAPLRALGYLEGDMDMRHMLDGAQGRGNLNHLLRADFSINVSALGRLLGVTEAAVKPKGVPLAELALPASVRALVDRLAQAPPDLAKPFRVILDGPEQSGRRTLAQALADHFGKPLRRIRPMEGPQPGAIVLVDVARGFDDDDWNRVKRHPGWVFLRKNGDGPFYDPSAECDVELSLREVPEDALRALAQRALEKAGPTLSQVSAEALGPLSTPPGALVSVIRGMERALAWEGLDAEGATKRLVEKLGAKADAGAGARAKQVVQPSRDLTQLCLAPDVRARFDRMVAAIRGRGEMIAHWNLDQALVGRAQGTVLLSGPSGTGKSMGAEVLAHELGLPLWRMEASELESPFVGESEQRLHAFFAKAKGQRCVLLMDECDSVLMARSGAEGSTKRYQTSLVNTWLRELDNFAGILVLTTNLPSGLDPAVERRIQFRMTFDTPGADVRQRIWETFFRGATIPGQEDLDLAAIAKGFVLSGGRIRNAFMAAAQLASIEGHMTQEILQTACKEEVESGITESGKRKVCGF